MRTIIIETAIIAQADKSFSARITMLNIFTKDTGQGMPFNQYKM